MRSRPRDDGTVVARLAVVFVTNEIARLRGRRDCLLGRAGLLRVFPGGLRQRHGALGGLHGLGVRRGAVADPPGNTLGDAGEPEQVVEKYQLRSGTAMPVMSQ